MEISTIGLDLAKNVFQIHGIRHVAKGRRDLSERWLDEAEIAGFCLIKLCSMSYKAAIYNS